MATKKKTVSTQSLEDKAMEVVRKHLARVAAELLQPWDSVTNGYDDDLFEDFRDNNVIDGPDPDAEALEAFLESKQDAVTLTVTVTKADLQKISDEVDGTCLSNTLKRSVSKAVSAARK